MSATKLLTNQTTNTTGTTSASGVEQTEFQSDGGAGVLIVSGVFGGASVIPEIVHEESEEGWLGIRDNVNAAVVITAAVNDEVIGPIPKGMKLRASITGATGTTDISVKFKTN